VEPLPPTWSTIPSDPGSSPRDDAPSSNGLPSRLLAVVVAVAGAAIVAVAVLGTSRSAGVGTVTLPAETSAARGTDPAIVVEVGGAVRRPGLVRLPPGSRVADAIAAAGGYGPAVDAAAAARSLRLAEPLADGAQVVVPQRGETPEAVAAAGPSAGDAAAGPIDVNTASEEELDTLPGVGPVTVGKIVAARTERPFGSVDELVERKVLGPATLAKIRDLIVAR
jgi:competence protein ComEA